MEGNRRVQPWWDLDTDPKRNTDHICRLLSADINIGLPARGLISAEKLLSGRAMNSL